MDAVPKISEFQKQIARQIGEFYLHINNGDYKKTEQVLADLRVSNIDVHNNVVSIYTARPGLIIGKRGTNISDLEKWLNCKVKVFETSCWLDYMTPYDDSYGVFN